MEGDRPNGYVWENSFKQSWEDILIDDENFCINTDSFSKKLKTHNDRTTKLYRRGILRRIFLIIDFSKCSNETDFAPNRAKILIEVGSKFLSSFFEHNPLCQVGILIMKDGVTIKICDLSENLQTVLSSLASIKIEGSGEPSVRNAIEVASSIFGSSSSHGQKEILLLFSSVGSSDCGNTVMLRDMLISTKARFNCISLTGELFFLSTLCKSTNGKFVVVLDNRHFLDELIKFSVPPETLSNETNSLNYLMSVGFPSNTENSSRSRANFSCPKCQALLLKIPADCTSCGLTLLTAPYLSKAYHSIFPPPHSLRFKSENSEICFSCAKAMKESPHCTCSSCMNLFCLECSKFTQENIYNCAGCVEK